MIFFFFFSNILHEHVRKHGYNQGMNDEYNINSEGHSCRTLLLNQRRRKTFVPKSFLSKQMNRLFLASTYSCRFPPQNKWAFVSCDLCIEADIMQIRIQRNNWQIRHHIVRHYETKAVIKMRGFPPSSILVKLYTLSCLTHSFMVLSPSWEAAYMQLLKNFPAFVEPEGTFKCSQEPSTEPYPEPDQSNPYHHTLSL
jgi:hypothetical protein